jgi:hypothetical protein
MKAVPTVGLPAKGNSQTGVKIKIAINDFRIRRQPPVTMPRVDHDVVHLGADFPGTSDVRTCASCCSSREDSTKDVSEWLNSSAIACICSGDKPLASSTTASLFPPKGRFVNTSKVTYRRLNLYP